MDTISEDFGYGLKCGNCIKVIERIIYGSTSLYEAQIPGIRDSIKDFIRHFKC